MKPVEVFDMCCMAVLAPFALLIGAVVGLVALAGWLVGKGWEKEAAERGERWRAHRAAQEGK